MWHRSLRLAGFLAALLLLFSYAVREVREPDFWYHLAVGQRVAAGTLDGQADPFAQEAASVRPGRWHAHEWLYEWFMFRLFLAGGPSLLLLWSAMLLLATWTLLYFVLLSPDRVNDSTSPSSLLRLSAAALVLLAALSGSERWSTRPELASYLFTAIVMLCFSRGGRAVWILPPLFALWANVHAAFVVGLFFLGTATLDRALESTARSELPAILAPLVLAGLATGLNPYGYGMLLYPFELVSDSYVLSTIGEWTSPDFHVMRLLELYLLASLAVFWLSRLRVRPGEAVLVLAMLHLLLGSARHLVFFTLLTAPVVLRHGLEAASRTPEAARRLAQRAAPLLVIALALWAAVRLPESLAILVTRPVDTRGLPVEACSFLARERPPGPLFHTYGWAGFILFRLGGAYRVFVDGRSEVYLPDQHRDYNLIVGHQPGWAELLDRHQINVILLPNDCDVSRALLEKKGWLLIHVDPVAVVFLRDVPANGAWSSRLTRRSHVKYR